MMRAAVITVSDSCFRGQRVDVSGPAVADLLQANAFHVISRLVVPDEQGEIEDALRQQCEVANLVVTTGGTGVAPRDVTPEATTGSLRPAAGRFRGTDAQRGQETDQVCPPEPLHLGHSGPISDCESAGQPTWRQELIGSSAATHSARSDPARGNSDPTRGRRCRVMTIGADLEESPPPPR